MPVVTISRGTFSGGRLLAEGLARQLGCECLESDVLSDAACRLGVSVPRLKAAMTGAPSIRRSLARERQMYLACITVALGERAMEEDLVYHGHAAHLLLPGVTHVVRVRVTADLEYRIRAAMERMEMTRSEARKYIASVDSDRARWVDFLFGVDWTDPSHYDMVLSLEHISVAHAAGMLSELAALQEFRKTPSSVQRLRDVLLAARARVRLGLDPRTADADVEVKANRGVLDVTHPPRQVHLAPLIHDVLEGLEGVRGIRCTIACTTVLWVQERFAPDSAGLHAMIESARRQDAAVELLELEPEASQKRIPTVAPPDMRLDIQWAATAEQTEVVFGEQGAEVVVSLPGGEGTKATVDALRKAGRAAGWRALPRDRVPDALDPGAKYGLVVVGDVFHDKPEAVRVRLAREFRAGLRDRLHVPVVTLDAIQRRLAFGPLDALQLVLALAALAAAYEIVFVHQDIVESVSIFTPFLHRVLRVLALLFAVPAVAALGARCVTLLSRAMRIE